MQENTFYQSPRGTLIGSEILDLRTEIMTKGVLLPLLVCSWFAMILTVIPWKPIGNMWIAPILWLVIFALAATCLYLRTKNCQIAAIRLCVYGIPALLLVHALANPGYVAMVSLVITCVALTLLAGAWTGWSMVACSAIVLAAAPASDPTNAGLAVIALSAVLVYLTQIVSKTLFQTLQWMTEGYMTISRQYDTMRDQSASLSAALKSLNQTSFALARANEQLRVMVKYAEDARRSKQQFAASVSHELRAPLNLVIGLSEIILSMPTTYNTEALPPSLLSDIHIINRNAQHLIKLVDDLLDLSQLDMNYLTILREPVQIGDLIKVVVRDVDEAAVARGLWLHVDAAPDLPEVYADQTRVKQIVLNLVSNAIRFTDQGGITIKARAVAADGQSVEANGVNSDQQPSVIISVSDTGIGIAEHDLQRIFEPFVQGSIDARHRHGGSGLGLAISKQLVELHGGHMWVESIAGAGSTFSFSLPSHPTALISSTQPTASAAFRREIGSLVVVERTPLLATMLERHLQGIPVCHKHSLAEVAGCNDNERPEVILVNEPNDVNGSSAWPEELSDIPILHCYVPTVPESSKLQTTTPGLRCSLVKPVMRSQFYDTLAEMLSTDGSSGGTLVEPRPAQILVVEDDEDTQQLLGRLLRSAPRELLTRFTRLVPIAVQSVEQALDVLHASHTVPIDAVILDIVLGAASGFDVLQAMDRDEELCHIPVCIVSGWRPNRELLMTPYLAVAKREGLSGRELTQSVAALLNVMLPGVEVKAQ